MPPKHLLDSLTDVQSRIDRSGRCFLFLDFDGTLVPIVPHPSEAVLEESVRDLLVQLSQKDWITLGIVSGRSLADIRSRVHVDRIIYAGNHGFEIEGPSLSFLEPTALKAKGPLRHLATRLTKDLAAIPGALVEYKGLTIGIHFRKVAESDLPTLNTVVEATIRPVSNRFCLALGMKIVEVRPRVDWNKGRAVLWILEQLGGQDADCIYLGDDVTDEDAFQALMTQITVKVGISEGSAAQYYLSDPGEVREFLVWLNEATARIRGKVRIQ